MLDWTVTQSESWEEYNPAIPKLQTFSLHHPADDSLFHWFQKPHWKAMQPAAMSAFCSFLFNPFYRQRGHKPRMKS